MPDVSTTPSLRTGIAARLASPAVTDLDAVSLADLDGWAAEIRVQQGWRAVGSRDE